MCDWLFFVLDTGTLFIVLSAVIRDELYTCDLYCYACLNGCHLPSILLVRGESVELQVAFHLWLLMFAFHDLKVMVSWDVEGAAAAGIGGSIWLE